MITKYNNKQLTNYNKKTICQKKKKLKKVSFYDPVVNAYREIPVSLAIKYIAKNKGLEKQIVELNKK